MTLVIIDDDKVGHTIEIPRNGFLGGLFNSIIKYFGKPRTPNEESYNTPIGKPLFDKTSSESIKKVKNERHDCASKILNDILNNNSPDISDIKVIYQHSAANDILKYIISLAKKNNISSSSANTGQKKYNIALRQPQTEHSFNLHDAWKNMIISNKYHEINKALVQSKLPQIKSLKYIYGEYANNIYKIFSKAIESRLERYQGLPTVTHYNQVGAMIFFSDTIKPNFKLITEGSMHDILEDLVGSELDKIDTKYNEILENLVPKEMQENIKYITNHYSILLKGIANSFGNNRGDFVKAANNYLSRFSKSKNFSMQAQKLQEKIAKIKHKKDNPYKESLEYLSKIFYAQYIEDMLASPLMIFLKERDLFTNSKTIYSMNLQSKIKNIKKQMIFANIVIETYLCREQLPYNLNNNDDISQKIISGANELRDNSIMLAKELLVSHIMQPNYTEGLQVVFNMIHPNNGRLYNVLYDKQPNKRRA